MIFVATRDVCFLYDVLVKLKLGCITPALRKVWTLQTLITNSNTSNPYLYDKPTVSWITLDSMAARRSVVRLATRCSTSAAFRQSSLLLRRVPTSSLRAIALPSSSFLRHDQSRCYSTPATSGRVVDFAEVQISQLPTTQLTPPLPKPKK